MSDPRVTDDMVKAAAQMISRDLLECIDKKLVTWLDRCHHPAVGGLEINIYLLTPAGAQALAGDVG